LVRRALVVVALLLLVGCSDDGGGPASPPPEEPEAVDGLVATIATNRLYATRHAFGLGVRNVGDEPVTVREVRLDSSLYDGPAGPTDALLVPGGRRFVLPIPYGEPRCDDPPGDPFGAVVVLDDGREVRLVAAEEYPGAIGRLHERECFAVDVHDRVRLELGDEWTRSGDTIAGELVLEQRHAGEAVTVDDAHGNVIFTLHTESAHPVVRVDDEEPAAVVPVTISADRCDPHAVAEFKTPMQFQVLVAIGDATPTPIPLIATGAARAALEALIATC
jgi:hypothetical protein